MLFPIHLTPEGDGAYLATCPVLPEVVSVGDSEREARCLVAEAIEAAISARLAGGREVPCPPRGPCPDSVRISALAGVKLALGWALRDSGCSREALGRRLGCGKGEVDRLLRLDQASSVGQLEAACRMLGRELHIEVC